MGGKREDVCVAPHQQHVFLAHMAKQHAVF